MKKTICLLMSAICVALFGSCGGNKIETSEDWIALCKSTSDVKVIDKAFSAMEPETSLDILEDLLNQITNDDVNSPLLKAKCEAMSYLWSAITYHNLHGDSLFSKGQKVRYADLSGGTQFNNALIVVSALIGVDGFTEIRSKFNSEALE